MCVCVCVYDSLVNSTKSVCDKSAIFNHHVGHTKMPYNDVFDDIVSHDLDLHFEDQRFESRQFR